jgi:predicted ATPase
MGGLVAVPGLLFRLLYLKNTNALIKSQRMALHAWPVCACAGQFALMSFSDLCGRPVAAADYIALTKVWNIQNIMSTCICTSAYQ